VADSQEHTVLSGTDARLTMHVMAAAGIATPIARLRASVHRSPDVCGSHRGPQLRFPFELAVITIT
jgi:hypothetical protein